MDPKVFNANLSLCTSQKVGFNFIRTGDMFSNIYFPIQFVIWNQPSMHTFAINLLYKHSPGNRELNKALELTIGITHRASHASLGVTSVAVYPSMSVRRGPTNDTTLPRFRPKSPTFPLTRKASSPPFPVTVGTCQRSGSTTSMTRFYWCRMRNLYTINLMDKDQNNFQNICEQYFNSFDFCAKKFRWKGWNVPGGRRKSVFRSIHVPSHMRRPGPSSFSLFGQGL